MSQFSKAKSMGKQPVTASKELPKASNVDDNGRLRNSDETDDLIEFDSVSNNDSSGDLEELKDKTAVSSVADTEKREKIRLKNEKKHARQREKRAQELHERCCGYLMSRKLEILSDQLVAMGFSSERATLALIMNKGKVEESVAWLFDGGEEEKNTRSNHNLEIDITEELDRILEMEFRYKCPKQEVEKAVVGFGGDLDKAEEAIKAQKRETRATEEKGKTVILDTPRENPTPPVGTLQRRNERDFNYTKTTPVVSGYPDSVKRNHFPARVNQPTPPVEKRAWVSTGSSSSAPYSQRSQVQSGPSIVRTEARSNFNGRDERNRRQNMVREPVIMMQRPQSVTTAKRNSNFGNTPPRGSTGFYQVRNNQSDLENLKSNMRSLNQENPIFQPKLDYSDFIPAIRQKGNLPPPGPQWNATGASSSSSSQHTVPSSQGLFSSWGLPENSNPSPLLNLNSGSGGESLPDYYGIDWKLEPTPFPPSMSNQGMRSNNPTNGGAHFFRSENSAAAAQEAAAAGDGGVREWTSPFAGKDWFSVPRQVITSPSFK